MIQQSEQSLYILHFHQALSACDLDGTRGLLARIPHGQLSQHYRQLMLQY